jgi:hypothetical protein
MTTYIFKNGIICADKTVFGQMEKYINDFLALLPQSLGDEVDIEKLLDPAIVFSEILSAFSASGGRIAAFFSLLMISGVIAYISSVYEGKISPLLGSAVCVVALGPAIYELLSLADEITSALEEICTFFSSLVPLILSVMIAGGSSSASVASGMQMSLVSSALQVISSELLLPMSRVTLILGGASAFGGYGAERVAKAIRNIFTKGLGLVSTLICALFALQSVIASAADTATLRLAKFTAQSIVPSVGSVITASMSTLSSGLAYARGVIGAGAIGGILWIMISPAAVLMAYRIAISVSLDFALSLGIKPYSRVLSAMQYALDGLISVFIVSGVLFIFQLVIFIKSGVEI